MTRFLENPDDIAEYIHGTSTLPSISDIDDLIVSMSSFVSRVMSKVDSKSINPREELLLNIKILLSHFNKIDTKMNPNNKNETIVSRRYSLQTYLIYPEIEYMYGYFRSIWEGGRDEEAFIQSIKSQLHNGLAGNFSEKLLARPLCN